MADTSASGSSSQVARNNQNNSRGSRNRRKPRGPANNPDTNGAPPTGPTRQAAGGRQFGGQLTRQLQADAPAFVPGGMVPASVLPTAPSSSQQQNKAKPQARKSKAGKQPGPPPQPQSTDPKNVPRARRASLIRSKANDIATRTHEDISHGIYECAICTNEVSRHSKIWSCRTCWTVFHIGCIKKWSKNEGSAVAQTARDGDTPPAKQWRCPGCNLPKNVLPTAYSCWCEKEIDPKAIPGLPPHSCGQTCGRSREFPKACPHPCDLICHAGPCPPCSSVGPEQSCFCGKKSTRRRCVETDYENGWSCAQECGDLMPCGEHTCPRPCHEGLCGECNIEVDARCYCGKVEKTIQCNAREEEKESRDWTGVFDCHQTCSNAFDCGVHQCEKGCHPQDEAVAHCPQSPDMISRCPCGKTALSDLAGGARTSCTDPIPNCKEPCGKALACGHACPQTCHTGECMSCLLKVQISCRCGRNSFKSLCHQGQEEPPQCMRMCKATLNCGRHECGERCCTGERKALDRQATKRKMKPLGVPARMLDDNIESEHICTRSCGRMLKCGNHTCEELCHKGPCNSCKEAIFEDISCNCGRTTLQAPLPCGTQPPPCNFPCRMDKPCGHPQVVHNCHFDTDPCPPCPFLVEKPCMCGKKVLKNQPCFRNDVPCGLVCGKLLKCGSHTCQKLCHRPGECEDASTACQQQCGKPKRTCGHPCEKTCHAPSACKEDKPCPSKIIITCDCQRRKEEVRCNARAGLSLSDSRESSLKCDDECARLIRNAQLALALQVPDDHQDDHVPYSTQTLSFYANYDRTWSHAQEQTLRIFAADETERRLRFQPMKPKQRGFIHSLAEDFGFDSESIDPEPHRHIVLFKTPKFVSAPMKTLAQAARIRRVQAPAPAVDRDATMSNRANEAHPQFNGLLLLKPRFALTIEEVSEHVQKVSPDLPFNVHFLMQRDGIALLPTTVSSPKQLEQQLIRLRSNLDAEVKNHHLAESTLLCSFDAASLSMPMPFKSDPTILYEQDPAMAVSSSNGAAPGGWSQVAAKGSSSPRRLAPQPRSVGERPVYTVLGSKLAEYKKKKEEEERIAKERKQTEKRLGKQVAKQTEAVGDSWEDEMDDEAEDTAEKATTGDEQTDGEREDRAVDAASGSGLLTPASRES